MTPFLVLIRRVTGALSSVCDSPTLCQDHLGDTLVSVKIIVVNVTSVYAIGKRTRHNNDSKYKSMFEFNHMHNSDVCQAWRS